MRNKGILGIFVEYRDIRLNKSEKVIPWSQNMSHMYEPAMEQVKV